MQAWVLNLPGPDLSLLQAVSWKLKQKERDYKPHMHSIIFRTRGQPTFSTIREGTTHCSKHDQRGPHLRVHAVSLPPPHFFLTNSLTVSLLAHFYPRQLLLIIQRHQDCHIHYFLLKAYWVEGWQCCSALCLLHSAFILLSIITEAEVDTGFHAIGDICIIETRVPGSSCSHIIPISLLRSIIPPMGAGRAFWSHLFQIRSRFSLKQP